MTLAKDASRQSVRHEQGSQGKAGLPEYSGSSTGTTWDDTGRANAAAGGSAVRR